jgi:DNA-binding NtrC family response regulator
LIANKIHTCFLTEDTGLAEVVARTLGEDFVVHPCSEYQPNWSREVRDRCDVVLMDLRSGSLGEDRDYSARMGFIREMSQVSSQPPIVVLCDEDNRSLILSAMELGAYDTATSPPNMIELRLILRRAFKSYTVEKELENLRDSARTSNRLHELYGTSPAMQELFGLVQKIAPCDVNVLITGETGTGKELLARAIHQTSARAGRPLAAFSCANLPETLIEDELFGHEKGAFTGALAMRRGRLESADQGTLFLDEIGDLSLGLQPKLLRVLQERNFERLGSNVTVNVNIRLICATNRDLSEMVQNGGFREDLYYRLNVVQMHLPPLRERRDDIALLAQLFLQTSAKQFNKKVTRFSQPALHALEEYAWPGNVRELENAVQRSVVLSEGQAVDLCHLPAVIRSGSDEPTLGHSYEEEVRQFKRRLLIRTLRECGWRKAESARTLGVARGYLHRLINQLEISEERTDSSSHLRPKAPLSAVTMSRKLTRGTTPAGPDSL